MTKTSLLCRYFDFDGYSLKKRGERAGIHESVFHLCVYYYEKSSLVLKGIATDAVGSLLIAYPLFLLKAQKIIEKCLSEKNVNIKSKFLNNLTQLLLQQQENSKSVSLSLKNKEKEEEEGLEEEMKMGNTHSGVISHVIGENRKKIISLINDSSLSVRIASLQCVETLLKQGLLNPLECSSLLISLQSQSSPLLSSNSFSALKYIHSKHPHFISTQLKDGFLRSWNLLLLSHRPPPPPPSNNNKNNALPLEEKAIVQTDFSFLKEHREGHFNNLFSLFKNNKQSRFHFLTCLLDLITNSPYQQYQDIYISSYFSIHLALLPFQTTEDVFFLIFHLNRILSLDAPSLLSKLKPLLSQASLPSNKKKNKKQPEEEKKEKKVQEEQNEELDQLLRKAHSHYVCAILKDLLKKIYKLTDNKCKEYTVSSSNSTTFTANDGVNIQFDASIFNPLLLSDYSNAHQLYKALKEFSLFSNSDFSDDLHNKKVNKRKPTKNPRKTTTQKKQRTTKETKTTKKATKTKTKSTRKTKNQKHQDDDEEESDSYHLESDSE